MRGHLNVKTILMCMSNKYTIYLLTIVCSYSTPACIRIVEWIYFCILLVQWKLNRLMRIFVEVNLLIRILWYMNEIRGSRGRELRVTEATDNPKKSNTTISSRLCLAWN